MLGFCSHFQQSFLIIFLNYCCKCKICKKSFKRLKGIAMVAVLITLAKLLLKVYLTLELIATNDELFNQFA